MVVNSNDNASTGTVSPARTSASNPSTSIFMNDGTPCFSTSMSSVVSGTRIVVGQSWASHPGAPRAAATKSSDTVDTVGLSGLTRSLAVPQQRPTADRSEEHTSELQS